MKKNFQVLIVDDNPDFCSALHDFLQLKGSQLITSGTVDEFKQKLSEGLPDILLIDRTLGSFNGLDLIPFIREKSETRNLPIIILTGCLDTGERIRALHIGADDYVDKTTNIEELYMRIVASYRRSSIYRSNENVIELENIKINLTANKAYRAEEELLLTKIEFNLLCEMVSNCGQILYRESLASKLLTLRNNNSRTLDVHINSLRKKLGSDSEKIRTVRGRGYIFQPQVAQALV